MKRPGWGTTIGILMIVFAGCTVKDSLESIKMPEMLERSPEIISEALKEEGLSQDSIDLVIGKVDSLTSKDINIDSVLAEEDIEGMDRNNQIEKFVLNNLSDVFNMSEYTKIWMIRFGYIGIGVAILYLLGGIFMLVVKPFSIPLAYFALAVSIIYVITRSIVIGQDAGNLISISTYVEGGISLIIDVVLILVIFSSDKFAYQQSGNPA